jgi:H+/Cl- antiporter ClcA
MSGRHVLPQFPLRSTSEPTLRSHIEELWHRGSAWIIGPVLIGLMAVGLALGTEYLGKLNSQLLHRFPYSPLLYMPAGFALLAWLCARYAPGSQAGGIQQAIAANDAEEDVDVGHLLSWRIVIGKALLTLGSVGIGASVGREGPTIQIGASIMHSFYRRGPFQSVEARRILILAGGAGGIAAAFNTPLAGIMFAIEELSKKHVFNANNSTMVTIVGSALISLFFLGSYTYFGTTESNLAWNGSLGAILLCGIVGGTTGGVFSRLLLMITFNMPRRVAHFIATRPFMFAALCGLIVAALGVASGGMIFGTGYQPTRLSLENTATLPWYFGFSKLIATLLSSVSGIVGGVFAPSLSIGAGLGDDISYLFPHMAAHSAIVLLVMTAYLSGVTRAPITSFVIAMEMTNNHQMLLPLMAVSVVASRCSRIVCPTPLYHRLADCFIKPRAAKQNMPPPDVGLVAMPVSEQKFSSAVKLANGREPELAFKDRE